MNIIIVPNDSHDIMAERICRILEITLTPKSEGMATRPPWCPESKPVDECVREHGKKHVLQISTPDKDFAILMDFWSKNENGDVRISFILTAMVTAATMLPPTFEEFWKYVDVDEAHKLAEEDARRFYESKLDDMANLQRLLGDETLKMLADWEFMYNKECHDAEKKRKHFEQLYNIVNGAGAEEADADELAGTPEQ